MTSREGVEQLASRGVDALLCTVTWTFAAQCVADRFGFSAVSGTVMHVDGDGILAGRVARYFEPEDKVAFLRDYCESRDLGMNQVVAIGDGQSDLPMFDAVGFSVGLNASPAAARRHRSQWTVIRSSTHCAPFPACSTTDVDQRCPTTDRHPVLLCDVVRERAIRPHSLHWPHADRLKRMDGGTEQ